MLPFLNLFNILALKTKLLKSMLCTCFNMGLGFGRKCVIEFIAIRTKIRACIEMLHMIAVCAFF